MRKLVGFRALVVGLAYVGLVVGCTDKSGLGNYSVGKIDAGRTGGAIDGGAGTGGMLGTGGKTGKGGAVGGGGSISSGGTVGGGGGILASGGVLMNGGILGHGGTVASGGIVSSGGRGGSNGSGGSSTGGSTGRTCGTIAGLGCPGNSFCDLASNCGNIADAAGLCIAGGGGCPAITQPVCGCDGKTYPNDCDRQANRVLKASDGICPPGSGGRPGSGGAPSSGGTTASGGVTGSGGVTSTGGLSTSQGGSGGSNLNGGAPGTGGAGTGGVVSSGGTTTGGSGGTSTGGATGTGGTSGTSCGGLAEILCAEGQFCDIASNCGAITGATGICVVQSMICTEVVAPVCGCDGRTYPNDCTRISAAIQKAADGPCAVDAGEVSFY